MDSRQQLRRQIRQQRRALNRRARQQAAIGVRRQLLSSQLFLRYQRFAVYLPNDGELDLHPFITRAQRQGKQCYLPVISRLSHNRLLFAAYQPGEKLVDNLFGIPEPLHGERRGKHPRTLDVILMPLVAFDKQGNRLGMGGGFYDRTLAYLMRQRIWRRPRLYGIAYEFQKVEALEVQNWDVPLDGVITETAIYRFRYTP